MRKTKSITLLVAIALMVASLLAFCLYRHPTFIPDIVVRWGNLAVAVVFAMRWMGDFRYCGIFKKRKGTLFASRDTWIYSPLCLALSLGLVYAALK